MNAVRKLSTHRPARPRALALAGVLCALASLVAAAPPSVPPPPQQKNAPPPPALRRTQSQRESHRLGYGGAVTVYGAPEGSLSVEGWPRADVDISADVELRADTEEDLARLAAVNRFTVSDDLNHLTVLTVGTHDRKYMKRVAKDFPKKLLGLPWRIDYALRVPAACDLEIFAGRGPLRLSGVEGAVRLNAGEADASFVLTGGDVEATVERGTVNFRLAAQSWRGRGASVRLGSGDMTVELPPNFHGDLDAQVLRAGRVENSHPSLRPRERTKPTEQSLQARGGAGGTLLTFTVADGTLRIK